MLKELHISNYRLFDDLTIPDLGQVNLIAGKNNTGKTALLEALRIWAANGDSTVVNHVLKNRGEFTPGWSESYGSLSNRNQKVQPKTFSTISLNQLQLSWNQAGEFTVSNTISNGIITARRLSESEVDPNTTPDYPKDNSIFVPFANQPFPLQNLWDKISLTPLEDTVLEITSIIEPNLIRIDLRGKDSKVLLKEPSQPVSLKSLGDGLDRALWLAVGLVSAKESKLLLIDEFEAGLHHSVQETLWEKIFQYAKEWNIQVFVTTHSIDAVRAFQEVSDRPENLGIGKFFRLQRNEKNTIEAVGYEDEELTTALEFDLETR